jgi:hypothetical protein
MDTRSEVPGFQQDSVTPLIPEQEWLPDPPVVVVYSLGRQNGGAQPREFAWTCGPQMILDTGGIHSSVLEQSYVVFITHTVTHRGNRCIP